MRICASKHISWVNLFKLLNVLDGQEQYDSANGSNSNNNKKRF